LKTKTNFFKKDKIIAIKRMRTKTGLKKIKWWVMKLKKKNQENDKTQKNSNKKNKDQIE